MKLCRFNAKKCPKTGVILQKIVKSYRIYATEDINSSIFVSMPVVMHV